MLIVKKFLIAFEDGVCVIKHWRINNFVRKDIYKETKYLDHKSTLFIRSNGVYTQTDDGRAIQIPNGHFTLESVDETLTKRQPRLGKVRVGKVSKEKDTEIAGASPAPFTLNEEIEKLEESPRRDLNIVALYLRHRKPNLTSREQFNETLRRHLRSSKTVSPFSDEQILKALDYAKREYGDIYTIETINKILTK
jgi:hypothetical protein